MFTEEMFAQRVMELRERLGVSQRDMSLSMGQGAAYINNIENRRALPSMTGFFYMCDYLKIEPKEFFDLDNTNPERLWLDSIEKKTDYKKWYCGHYHTSKKIDKMQFMFENFDVLSIR